LEERGVDICGVMLLLLLLLMLLLFLIPDIVIFFPDCGKFRVDQVHHVLPLIHLQVQEMIHLPATTIETIFIHEWFYRLKDRQPNNKLDHVLFELQHLVIRSTVNNCSTSKTPRRTKAWTPTQQQSSNQKWIFLYYQSGSKQN
jgi:membrane protein implicated in regulation of membrane protease activity